MEKGKEEERNDRREVKEINKHRQREEKKRETKQTRRTEYRDSGGEKKGITGGNGQEENEQEVIK